jgi:hypothetical protein
MYLRLYNQGCPMQPRCDINEVLSALPELIERGRELGQYKRALELACRYISKISDICIKGLKQQDIIDQCAEINSNCEICLNKHFLAQAERGQDDE